MEPLDSFVLPPGITVDRLRMPVRQAGAVFAFLHGSRVVGTARPDSDVDVAAWFADRVDA